MKAQAAVHACLAAALVGMIPSTEGGYQISLVVIIVILVISSIVLLIAHISTRSFWTWLVNTANGIDVGYTATGLGLVLTGAGLIGTDLWVFAPLLICIGFIVLGVGILNNIRRAIRYRKTKSS